MRPLGKGRVAIGTAARRMLAGDFHARTSAPKFGTSRELRDLATVFNRMADALRRSHDDLERMVDRRTRQLSSGERRLRKAKEAAELANEAKSAFLAQMSNELRTGLGVTIATALARLLGGDLVYRSEPDIGTLVILTLLGERLVGRAAA